MAKLTLILPLLSTILTLASSAPTGFTFPLSNGFPNPDQSQLTTIEQQAHGTLPNTPPPTSLDPESETALAFIAFNELFEAAFFTELIANITSNAAGYTDIPNQAQVLKTLNAVVAQEQLHELSANDAFTTLTGAPIQPCTYAFPVDTFNASIALASQFTDLSLGLLSDVQTIFAAHNDSAALIRLISAIVGQEGEQNGFYRSLLNEIPPALPFLTAGALDFSFNVILQNFVVPGSCPSLDLLVSRGLKQFGVLKVLTTNFTADKDSTGEFSIASYYPAEKRQEGSSNSTSQAFLTYINQQNAPFSVPMTMTKNDGGAVLFFNASFPAETKNLSGLVVAAVTNGDGPFAGPEEVAAATLFGPGFIDVEA